MGYLFLLNKKKMILLAVLFILLMTLVFASGFICGTTRRTAPPPFKEGREILPYAKPALQASEEKVIDSEKAFPDSEKESPVSVDMGSDKTSSGSESESRAVDDPAVSRYPYTLRIGCFSLEKNGEKALSVYRRKGLSVRLEKDDSGKTLWILYAGRYRTYKEAYASRKRYRLSVAIISKKPYANLVGVFESEEEMNNMFVSLKKLGYDPYAIKGSRGNLRLFVGDFKYRENAQKQCIRLKTENIDSRVVER